jgi:hypothetical protein
MRLQGNQPHIISSSFTTLHFSGSPHLRAPTCARALCGGRFHAQAVHLPPVEPAWKAAHQHWWNQTAIQLLQQGHRRAAIASLLCAH